MSVPRSIAVRAVGAERPGRAQSHSDAGELHVARRWNGGSSDRTAAGGGLQGRDGEQGLLPLQALHLPDAEADQDRRRRSAARVRPTEIRGASRRPRLTPRLRPSRAVADILGGEHQALNGRSRRQHEPRSSAASSSHSRPGRTHGQKERNLRGRSTTEARDQDHEDRRAVPDCRLRRGRSPQASQTRRELIGGESPRTQRGRRPQRDSDEAGLLLGAVWGMRRTSPRIQPQHEAATR